MALLEVPLWCDSERHEVKLEDVRAWLDYAIIEEDRYGKMLKKKLAELEVRSSLHLGVVASPRYVEWHLPRPTDFMCVTGGDEDDREGHVQGVQAGAVAIPW